MPRKKNKYYKRPDGLYEAIRIINGKRVAFRGKSAAIVEQKMIAYKESPPPAPLFKDVSADWEEEHSKTIAYNTAQGYRSHNKIVTDYFGEYKIDEITSENIKTYISSFKTQAKKTVTNRFLTLNLIFTYAKEKHYISENPCSSIKIKNLTKGLKKTMREAPTEEEAKTVMQFATDPDGLMAALILCTGCRKGEAIGLLDSDVIRNPKGLENKISITRSVYFENCHPRVKPPKSDAGVRSVPVPDSILSLLPSTTKGKPVFPGKDGGYLTEPEFRRMWTRWQKKTGLKLTAHQLRHGYATILFEEDIKPKDMQSYLGHAQLSTTMDVYTHIRNVHKEAVDKKVMGALNKL